MYSRTITPRVRMSVVNYFLNRSSSMCLWHKERHEQIPLNEEQKMTKGSFLNYQPGRLGNLANFQVESNLCNANQVHPSLCHNGESLGHRKAQVPLSQVQLNKLKWSRTYCIIHCHKRPVDRECLSPHIPETGALTKETATGNYFPVSEVELLNC